MLFKKVVLSLFSFILISSGIISPAYAGMPPGFSGNCINVGTDRNTMSHNLSFNKVPGGISKITIETFGYVQWGYGLGLGQTDLNLSLNSPFTATVSNGDDVNREFMFGGGSYTAGYVNYTAFRAQAYGHNGLPKGTPIWFECPSY